MYAYLDSLVVSKKAMDLQDLRVVQVLLQVRALHCLPIKAKRKKKHIIIHYKVRLNSCQGIRVSRSNNIEMLQLPGSVRGCLLLS